MRENFGGFRDDGRSKIPIFFSVALYSNITDNLFTTPLRKKHDCSNKAAITASHDFMHLSSVLLCTKASKVSRRQPFTAVVNTLALFIDQSFFIRPGCCFCACEARLKVKRDKTAPEIQNIFLIFYIFFFYILCPFCPFKIFTFSFKNKQNH